MHCNPSQLEINMKLIGQSIHTVFAILMMLTSLTGFSQSIPLIDSLVREAMMKKQIPGISMAVLQHGKLIHKKTYGYSVVEHHVESRLETIYEMASITKQFIAAGILLLEEDGKLNLQEPISTYLDSLPPKWRKLSLYRLLTHTAGLAPMEHELKSLKEGGWPKYLSRKALWTAALEDSIYASPGTKFRYHNFGYSLAIFIIEKVTGSDHRDFFANRIFKPLGMQQTFFEDQGKITPNQAQGYTLRQGKLAKIWRVSQEEIGIGDGIYSCLEDMIKWNNALNGYGILEEESLQKMFSRVTLSNGETFRYGLGWWIPSRNGIKYYYHNGITGPEILKIPSENVDIIILSNLGQGSFDHVPYWGLANEIASTLVEKFRHEPVGKAIGQEELRRFVGNYEYQSGGNLEISLHNDALYLTDQYGESLLMFLGNQSFVLNDYPLIFEFINNDLIKVQEETWNDDFAIRKND